MICLTNRQEHNGETLQYSVAVQEHKGKLFLVIPLLTLAIHEF